MFKIKPILNADMVRDSPMESRRFAKGITAQNHIQGADKEAQKPKQSNNEFENT